MKEKLTIILVLISLSLYAQKWDVYKNQDFGFRVEFDGEMKTINQSIPVGDANIEMNMFFVDNSTNSSANNMVYSVAHTAYNIDDYSKEDPERDNLVLNSAVKGASKNVNGTILSNEDFILNGFPGKQSIIEIQGAYIHLKLILVKHELYFVQVICTVDKDDNNDISRFFESFDLIKIK